MRECHADVWAETAADLESTTVIDFSGNPGMYESFYERYGKNEEWVFDAQSKKATLTW